MGRKNTLKGWQMGILAALLALMLSTMFMPALHFNGDVAGQMYTKGIKTVKKAVKKHAGLLAGIVENFIDDEFSDDTKGKIDDFLEEMREKEGINLTSFSPLRIMTHSLSDYFPSEDANGNQDKKDDKQQFASFYNGVRIFLIVNYVLALIVLLIVILSFALKWSKKIPLILSIVYSVLSLLLFAFLRFGMLKVLIGKSNEGVEGFFDLIGLGGVVRDLTSSLTSFLTPLAVKMLSCIYSVSFVIALIVAFAVLVMSILSLAMGNREEVLEYDREYEDNYYDSATGGITSPTDEFIGGRIQSDLDTGENVFDVGDMNNRNRLSPNQNPIADDIAEDIFETIPVTDHSSSDRFETIPVTGAQQSAPIPMPFVNQASGMGKVCCTKGVAVGQGFQLPSDRKVVVGKSPSRTNLTINHPSVSNVHCSICYNPAENTYIVKDHSTNGTFVNGSRMPKGVEMEYPAGTVLVLADGVNEITLG